MEEIGQDLGAESAKFSGGVIARDGSIFAIPSNASRVMKFDPNNNFSRYIGDDLGEGLGKWCGGVLGSENIIYGIPYHSHYILKIDTRNETTTLVGDDLGGGYGWTSGTFAQDGCIYCMPFNGNRILCFDPTTETSSLVGQDILCDLDGCKYSGTVLGNDGCLYGVPYDASRVLKFDPSNGNAMFIGTDLGVGGEKWMGGVQGSDGKIYGVPYQSNCILCIDVFRQSTSAAGHNLPTEYGWDGAISGEDGCLYFTPSYSKQIVKFDPLNQSTTSLVSEFLLDHSAISGGVLGHDGHIYLIPSSSNRIFRIDTRSKIDNINKVLEMKLWSNGMRILNESTLPQDVKLKSLRKENKDGDDALCIALRHNAPVDLVKSVVEANYLALRELDYETGFYPFMMAAMWGSSSTRWGIGGGPGSNLEVVYELLRYLPGLMHDFVHQYARDDV